MMSVEDYLTLDRTSVEARYEDIGLQEDPLDNSSL